MTQIAFHFGAPDRLPYTCRLLRKVVATGMRAVVWCEDDLCVELDRALWSLSPTDFIAHAINDATPAVMRRSPVLITSVIAQGDFEAEVLVNLHPQFPVGLELYSRVIEVVSVDGPDKDSARTKWKQYTAAGHAIQRHDLKLREATA